MNLRSAVILFYTTLLSLYFLSCANITSPTGGPLDSIPPHVVLSSPTDQSLGVNTDELEITFDEIIKAGNIKGEIIITPDIEDYDYRILLIPSILLVR